MRRIVSAAMKLADGRVIMCVRHGDMLFHKALGVELGSPAHFALVKHDVAGFVDCMGEFLTREEAWPVAMGAGQIIPAELGWQTGSLHSEHLY